MANNLIKDIINYAKIRILQNSKCYNDAYFNTLIIRVLFLQSDTYLHGKFHFRL